MLSEGLGFNLCVAPFLNVYVPNLPQGQRWRLVRGFFSNFFTGDYYYWLLYTVLKVNLSQLSFSRSQHLPFLTPSHDREIPHADMISEA